MSDLTRFTLPEGRVYTDGNDLFLPSVTTVIDQQPEPPGIKYWKKKYDGKDGREHWRDIRNYKGNRGTMIHYRLLNEFSPTDIFGQNEKDSTDELKLKGDWGRYQHDLVYAEEAWEEIKRVRGINEESVLDVECFVANVAIGYAGQFDLLYVDRDSNLVLADIKTGKGIYPKYMMQLVAYENALDVSVDRLEVIRIYPDNQEWQVSSDDTWSESRDELWNKFCELRAGMDDVQERMEKIAETGVDDS